MALSDVLMYLAGMMTSGQVSYKPLRRDLLVVWLDELGLTTADDTSEESDVSSSCSDMTKSAAAMKQQHQHQEQQKQQHQEQQKQQHQQQQRQQQHMSQQQWSAVMRRDSFTTSESDSERPDKFNPTGAGKAPVMGRKQPTLTEEEEEAMEVNRKVLEELAMEVNRKVLVVEDNVVSQKLMKPMLECDGWQVSDHLVCL
jgi:hypothetical protein